MTSHILEESELDRAIFVLQEAVKLQSQQNSSYWSQIFMLRDNEHQVVRRDEII